MPVRKAFFSYQPGYLKRASPATIDIEDSQSNKSVSAQGIQYYLDDGIFLSNLSLLFLELWREQASA